MKSILMSIKPQWVAKILNGEKTIEIRKKFPKDYVGWVYIYCTKDKKYANLINRGGFLTGMVVARFWCNKAEQIEPHIIKWEMKHETNNTSQDELLKQACLNIVELLNYCGGVGYAIHITKLEIFDRPKELSEFKSYKKNIVNTKINGMIFETELDNSLTKAPQSWCYVEVEDEE